MPTFYEEAEFDISIEDFLDSLDDREVNELIEILIEDEFLKPESKLSDNTDSIAQRDWNETCAKLSDFAVRMRMTDEQIQMIEDIVKLHST